MRTTLLWMVVLAPWLALSEEQPKAEVRTANEKELVDDDGYVVRFSLPTQADVDAWKEPGIRVSLAYMQGYQLGWGPAPGFTTFGAVVRPWVRLDPTWSLAANFSWSVGSGVFEGLRWAATLEPTWHPWRGLGVSLGVGYGGLMGGVDHSKAGAPPGAPVNNPSSSRLLRDDEWMYSCEGGAFVGVGRVEYQFVVGPLFSTGPFLQVDAQRTVCGMNWGPDPETGGQIVLRQWWQNAGASLGWWATWR